MARYNFIPGKEYAGRVLGIWKKSLENRRLNLIRLEFEIFQILDDQRLSSTGKVACRDLVVGQGIDVTVDPGVAPFVLALQIPKPNVARSWLALDGCGRWVKVVFGNKEEKEHRNVFQKIFPLDGRPKDQIIEYDYDLDAEWVTVAAAADDLECSEATVRRRVDAFESTFGSELVRRTSGGHRRINIHLLKNLVRQR